MQTAECSFCLHSCFSSFFAWTLFPVQPTSPLLQRRILVRNNLVISSLLTLWSSYTYSQPDWSLYFHVVKETLNCRLVCKTYLTSPFPPYSSLRSREHLQELVTVVGSMFFFSPFPPVQFFFSPFCLLCDSTKFSFDAQHQDQTLVFVMCLCCGGKPTVGFFDAVFFLRLFFPQCVVPNSSSRRAPQYCVSSSGHFPFTSPSSEAGCKIPR